MSILIPGMEMPKACIACPFAKYWSEPTKFADDSPFQKVFIVCSRTRSKIQNETSRNDDCPLVPVPPHGDLIDKHTLIDGILYELGASEAIGDREEYAHWERVLTYVRKAPTIIPADKEGE